jgi:hypothetical protein
MSIEAVKAGAFDLGEKMVTLAVVQDKSDSFVHSEERILSVQFTYKKNEWSDAEIVRIARADFHALCKELVEATRDWQMDEEARAACEHPLKEKPIKLPF